LIEPHHKRIVGMHVTKKGKIALVWLAINPDSRHVHIYDCCTFNPETHEAMREAVNTRGRFIPLAWSHEEFAKALESKGVRILPEKTSDSDEMAEVVSRDIWERIRAKRITADKNLKDWAEEAKSLQRLDGKIPRDSHPLMSATRIAMQEIKSARSNQRKLGKKKHQRRVAIV